MEENYYTIADVKKKIFKTLKVHLSTYNIRKLDIDLNISNLRSEGNFHRYFTDEHITKLSIATALLQMGCSYKEIKYFLENPKEPELRLALYERAVSLTKCISLIQKALGAYSKIKQNEILL